MKTLKMFLLVLLSLRMYAQSNLDIPEKNQIVLDAVEEKMGTKVKTGICFDLVDYALRKVDKKWHKRSDRKYVYGHKVSVDKILPGDIALYKGCKFSDGGRAISHVSVIYYLLGDGRFEVAEQNTKGKLEESVVEVNKVDLSTLIKGKMEFYRPYSDN